MNDNRKYCKTLSIIFSAGLLLVLGFFTLAQGQRSVAVAGGSPLMNYEKELLRREDVQNELNLSSLQKEFLSEFINQTPDQVATRAIKNMPPVKIIDVTKLSDEERKQWDAEISKQAAEQVRKFMEEEKREIESVLRPEQKKRLHELDLQWRGVLALADSRVADEINLSAENRKKIADIDAGFEVERINLVSRAAQENSQNGGSRQKFMKDFDDANSPMYRKREALLQEFEGKIFNLLSDDEKTRWRLALGNPFDFRDDEKPMTTVKIIIPIKVLLLEKR